MARRIMRRTRRRRTRRRRPTRKSRTLATKSYVKRVIASSSETKWEFTNFITNLQPGVLVHKQIGDDIFTGVDVVNDLIGNKIKLLSTQLRYSFHNTQNTPAHIRIMCLQFRDNAGPATDLFHARSTPSPFDYQSGAAILSRIRYMLNRTKCMVLYDRTINLPSTADTQGGKNVKIGATPHVPLRKTLKFEGSGRNPTEIKPNIYWVWFAENDAQDITKFVTQVTDIFTYYKDD